MSLFCNSIWQIISILENLILGYHYYLLEWKMTVPAPSPSPYILPIILSPKDHFFKFFIRRKRIVHQKKENMSDEQQIDK